MEKNQNHRSITELEVDGVIYRETKSLTNVVTLDGPDPGKEEQEIVCTRSIGDKSYSVRKIISRVLKIFSINKFALI